MRKRLLRFLIFSLGGLGAFGCDNNAQSTGAASQGATVSVPDRQPANVAASSAQATATADVSAQPAAAATAPVSTGDPLIDKINAKKAKVASDMQATSPVVRRKLEKGASQSYQAALSGPPYCQTYLAAAADGVSNIDLVLESPSGVKEAADSIMGNVAVIAGHCPSSPGIYKLTVSMPEDEGEFAVQVFSK